MALLDTVRKASCEGDVDFLREGVRVLAQAVMEAEVAELTGAPRGERDPERRLGQRNGYRERRWGTRVGTHRAGGAAGARRHVPGRPARPPPASVGEPEPVSSSRGAEGSGGGYRRPLHWR